MSGAGMLFQDSELEALAQGLLYRIAALRAEGAPASLIADSSKALDKVRLEQRERRYQWSGGRLI